ncbi:uncharacterized protein LOC111400583 [Olea europaea var. sylvestris]|uniref:uncharacterized protein LOC111400583 n=1 Tax=Olea europaea var. sylvestris TaxID=158386 RepID=UPI000C1D7425|nr:uncharacterized protein LOC111400583 [Olea europaea var. sylvestris]
MDPKRVDDILFPRDGQEMVAEFDLIMEEHIRRAQAREIQYNASNEEQMSPVIRCVDDSVGSPMVQEYWIEFLNVDEASGFGLFTELKIVLKNLELDINNIRGQGYDNGANLSGRHRGVQKSWESHVESVKPIKEQSIQIRNALLDLANIVEDPKTKSEAESLAIYEVENFEFLLGIVIWYKLLHAVNTVSKFFQAESMYINP